MTVGELIEKLREFESDKYFEGYSGARSVEDVYVYSDDMIVITDYVE